MSENTKVAEITTIPLTAPQAVNLAMLYRDFEDIRNRLYAETAAVVQAGGGDPRAPWKLDVGKETASLVKANV